MTKYKIIRIDSYHTGVEGTMSGCEVHYKDDTGIPRTIRASGTDAKRLYLSAKRLEEETRRIEEAELTVLDFPDLVKELEDQPEGAVS